MYSIRRQSQSLSIVISTSHLIPPLHLSLLLSAITLIFCARNYIYIIMIIIATEDKSLVTRNILSVQDNRKLRDFDHKANCIIEITTLYD